VPLIVKPDLGFFSSDASRPTSCVIHGALAPPPGSAFENAITHDVEELCSSFDRGLSGEADDDEDEDDPMDGGAEDGEASMRNLGACDLAQFEHLWC